tara:strand:- start:687 stop:872 length:186 start_codon:yes stop_codon:yes gene_type:complete
MGSSAPKPPKSDPATISSSPGEAAKKKQELENRRKGGFYSGFKNIQASPNSTTGGGNQTIG